MFIKNVIYSFLLLEILLCITIVQLYRYITLSCDSDDNTLDFRHNICHSIKQSFLFF